MYIHISVAYRSLEKGNAKTNIMIDFMKTKNILKLPTYGDINEEQHKTL